MRREAGRSSSCSSHSRTERRGRRGEQQKVETHTRGRTGQRGKALRGEGEDIDARHFTRQSTA